MHQAYTYFRLYSADKVLFKSWVISILVVETFHTVVCMHSAWLQPLATYRVLVVVAIILSLVALGFSAAAAGEAFIVRTFDRFWHFTWLDSAGFGVTVVSDLLTTTVLIITLMRSRTGMRTKLAYDTQWSYRLQTLTRATNLIFLGVSIVATKVYSNSLLAVLNSRETLRHIPADNSIHLSALRTTSRMTRTVQGWSLSTAEVSGGSETHVEVKLAAESV
ncbi:hypothetical protein BD413DRAFT_495241 [Trametes elegans]|nr:hypothetical protein BD413DRAFT_495241 [Trametes elegans]